MAELTITDWIVGEVRAEVKGRYIGPRDWTIAAVSFKVPVQRRIGFYTMKTFLPLTLIVCMSWAVFWIKPGLLPPQIGVSTSAILTLIAFQFSLGYLLPRLSYLTRADRFLIGSTLLVFMAFGEALRTSYLANRDQEDRALRIDKLSRVLFPVLFSCCWSCPSCCDPLAEIASSGDGKRSKILPCQFQSYSGAEGSVALGFSVSFGLILSPAPMVKRSPATGDARSSARRCSICRSPHLRGDGCRQAGERQRLSDQLDPTVTRGVRLSSAG